MNNTNLLSITECLKRDGRTLVEIAQAVMFGDENATALCEHGVRGRAGRKVLPWAPVDPASRGPDLKGEPTKTSRRSLPCSARRGAVRLD